jgi:hypothetical protein
MKIAQVKYLFEKGDRKDVQNEKPMSILQFIFSKI